MNKKFIILLIIGLAALPIIFFISSDSDLGSEQVPIDADIGTNIQKYPDIDEWKTYKVNNFSFKYRESLELSRTSDKGGEIIAVENNNFGFQIFIMPFNEMGPITTERILKDLPSMKINNPTEADMGGVESLVLYGYIDGLGETFEVWVVYGGKLHQIMTSQVQEKALLEVLDTWKWE